MLSDFIPALPVLAAYTVAAIVLGLTPGPDMTLFLSKTVSQSRAAGLAAFAGASSGLVVHSVLIAAGLSALLAASATAFTVLKVVGALYLAYLAVDAVRHGSALSLDRKGGPSASARSTSRVCSSISSTRRSSSSSLPSCRSSYRRPTRRRRRSFCSSGCSSPRSTSLSASG